MIVSKQFILFSLCSLLVLFSGCRSHEVGRVSVEGNSTPRFKFTGLSVTHLLVYQVPRQYLSKGIPLNELTKDNPNTQWLIDGVHDAHLPINYGSVPEGMKEIVSSKPLAEGTIYFVSTYIGTEDTGAFVGQYFKLQNGRTVEVHEDFGEKSENR
jgi:hypothetical protein